MLLSTNFFSKKDKKNEHLFLAIDNVVLHHKAFLYFLDNTYRISCVKKPSCATLIKEISARHPLTKKTATFIETDRSYKLNHMVGIEVNVIDIRHTKKH